MKIWASRALPRFRGGASSSTACGGRRCRRSALAAEERQLFPLGAIEWCLERGGIDAADLDAVVFYERSMLKFERILTWRASRVPAFVALLSAGHQELARRKSLGAGIVAFVPRRPAPQDPVYGSPPIPRRDRFSHVAVEARAILTADGVGEWRR